MKLPEELVVERVVLRVVVVCLPVVVEPVEELVLRVVVVGLLPLRRLLTPFISGKFP